jgi:hypothetical protein
LGVLEFDAGGNAREAEEPGEGLEGEGSFEEDVVGRCDDHVVEEGEAFQILQTFGNQPVKRVEEREGEFLCLKYECEVMK